MKRFRKAFEYLVISLLSIFFFTCANSWMVAQTPSEDQKAALQEKLAALKESMAKNQQALARYSWKQKTEMILDGEVKSTTIDEIRIGPDGKQQKTTISAPPEKKEEEKSRRGRRGGGRGKEKVIEKKTAEMKEYVTQLMTLSKSYMKPDPDRLKQAAQAGKASFSAGDDATLGFTDYFKTGDSLEISLSTANQSMNHLKASTYLEDEEDPVKIGLEFALLADGTSYLSAMQIDSLKKKLTLKVTSYDHQPVN